MKNISHLTLAEASLQTRERLLQVSETSLLDAEVLIAWIIEKTRTWVKAHPEAYLLHEQEAALESATSRLEQGEPLAYILGHWEFYGLDFIVTPATLIPRPETELLVEFASRWITRMTSRIRMVDVGCGSGCIAIALTVNHPNLYSLASDVSFSTLEVAQRNALIYKVSTRVSCVQAHLLPPTREQFDLICANLPYIPTQKLLGLKIFNREPTQALNGGEDGLSLLKELLQIAPAKLAKGGLMLLEIEASQGQQVRAMAQQSFPQSKVQIHPDLAGYDRLVSIET